MIETKTILETISTNPVSIILITFFLAVGIAIIFGSECLGSETCNLSIAPNVSSIHEKNVKIDNDCYTLHQAPVKCPPFLHQSINNYERFIV
jgi:hypothetical protein